MKVMLRFKYVIPYILVFLLIVCINYIYNSIKSNSAGEVTSSSISLNDVGKFNKRIVNATDHLPDDKILSSGFGLRIYDNNGKFLETDKLILNNDPINFYVSMVNGTSQGNSVGFVIFIDGFIQEIFIDQDDKSKNIFSTKLESRSLINVPIAIKKPKVSNDTKHNLLVVMLYDLDKLPGGREMYIDFYVNFIYKTVDMGNLIPTISNRDFKEVTFKDKEAPHSDSKGVIVGIQEGDSDQDILRFKTFVQNKKTMILSGKAPEGKYSSVILVNNEPVSINGNTEFFWEVNQKGEYLREKVTLDPILNKQPLPLFVLTIPIKEELPIVFGSSKQILEIE